ncbi:MAG: hypothetical protein PHO32_06485 [Candidatus Cloacimonetes bacterium]|nr:hypothetical protein [Candidatus Cloacimonadota bacterium]
MKRLLLLLAVLVMLLSCSKEPTKITVKDSNEDQVAHLGPNPDIMGNTEIFFIPATIQGSAIWVINGPGAHVGLDIRDKGNSAFIYYGDSYIGKGSNSAQTGTQIPWDRWMRVRLVVYESGLSGYIVSFLEALGLDFFDSLQDYMIDKVYENDVYLSAGGKQIRTAVKCIDWEKRN